MVDAQVPGFLILWDLEFVLDWIARNEAYARLRSRANSGGPAITVQVLAEVLRILRLRASTLAKLDQTLEEIHEHFAILDLTARRAEAYAEFAEVCRRSSDTDVRTEPWFAWQVALSRSEGHRVMTKAPQRYRGLLDDARLA